MWEKIIENKICKYCNIWFDITDKDIEFYNKISPKFNWKKHQIPTPTLCPNCRLQRRLSWRNESKLYRSKCDMTGENIISAYSPDKPYKVYEKDVWMKDWWNPLDYWINFDFNKPFFDQFKYLSLKVPRISVFRQWEVINSEYTNLASNNKDCYLIFSSNYDEKCWCRTS